MIIYAVFTHHKTELFTRKHILSLHLCALVILCFLVWCFLLSVSIHVVLVSIGYFLSCVSFAFCLSFPGFLITFTYLSFLTCLAFLFRSQYIYSLFLVLCHDISVLLCVSNPFLLDFGILNFSFLCLWSIFCISK